ncbi:MAG TPA: PhzF family phenazine biosynthesis protein [Tepidisphaeraceae bacterium]|jgi:predicted PhzF superfamily epimerase YddE/YHI9|nr:PhzF family phenazine biosynthesis protein [Tepidisphaeraceae bacterium]
MQAESFHVDAFTDKPFGGNPAAVCLLNGPTETEWMQHVAREMNLSDTAFVTPTDDRCRFGLRWFTPTVEVDLCGHATLAAAHVLLETNRLAREDVAQFETRSGVLTARYEGDWIELDFPATPAKPTEAPPHLKESFDPSVRDRITAIAKSRFDFLVELDLPQPDFAALKADLRTLALVSARGVIITTRQTTDSKFDFASRFFAPQLGIDEDPVTGSAYCALGPWWRERLNKNEMLAFQASPRGGVVRVRVENDRVRLGGQAVSISRGMLLV